MTTLVLSAAGAALGGAVGGSVLGLSSVAIGRFAGAMIGNAIDQRVLGAGGAAVEAGRIDRYRITGSAEGRAIAQVYGRMRIGGHVIWASRFQENVTTSGGGKGAPPRPKRRDFSYSVSLALGLCDGEILGVTRVWADGRELSLFDVTMRVYPGSEDQLPDPKIEAVEGAGTVPAYRGTAYVVFEDLDLAPFGNRVPQFSFEVSRPTPAKEPEAHLEPTQATRAVALMPGTGEYALATEPVYYENGPGQNWPANVNSPSGQADFVTALSALETELPNCEAASLIVSWFGNDLRCAECEIRPKVEAQSFDGSMPWQVSGVTRQMAQVVPTEDGRPIYGGTPADDAIVQALLRLKEAGQAVMYYPFILMDQQAGNGQGDPWSDEPDQPVLPWRGRVTLEKAPGQPGSADGTSAANQEVADFFGMATAADFSVSDGRVQYSGPEDWGYRRFILHQAALCKAAGGVESFCIGSEMRGLTWIRGTGGEFVAVTQLIDLLREVRLILGPDVKLGYAADWSEYFGYQPQDGSGDRYFHLDALWADPDLDFIGIDNYMPLSDWRDGDDHADAAFGSIYDLDYLMGNIEGGEGYDWFYHSEEARAAQIRSPIEDGAYGEPWIYRYKDIRNWWANAHHERIGGIREPGATAWEPMSKPIVFTEFGCAAIDKGTNQPNKFLDPKSSESTLPHYSSGQPDDYLQMQYLKAMTGYWNDPANNPVSPVYHETMIDMSRAFVWAWDTRPFPRFPANLDLWSDGENYRRGHWLSGRSTHRSLASVVHEICASAGVQRFDVSGLVGVVRGFATDGLGETRRALQALMLRYGFDAVEQGGFLRFVMRGAQAKARIAKDAVAVLPEIPTGLERRRMSDAETIGKVRVDAVQANADYDTISEEAMFADDDSLSVSRSELNIAMLRGEARQVAERWLAEARLAQDVVRFALPLSRLPLQVGQVVSLLGEGGGDQSYRIDRIEIAEALLCEAVRVSPEVYEPRALNFEEGGLPDFNAPVPVFPLFMDIPLLSGEEVPHAPHVVAVADPWAGAAAIFSALSDNGYALNRVLSQQPIVGVLETPLAPARSGVWDNGPPMRVRMIGGRLESKDPDEVLAGANLAVIGTSGPEQSPDAWEVIQFAKAELVAEGTYDISVRLRGQAGSDSLEFGEWPAGSWFVLLDTAAQQIDLPASALGQERHYRIGPASRPVSDPVYVDTLHAFSGNGLRPYAPVHLLAVQGGSGDIDLSWIRRSRIGGDGWAAPDIPLGEDRELYRLQMWQAGTLLIEDLLTEPKRRFSSAEQAAHSVTGTFEVRVAQVSALYGVGPDKRLLVTIA